MLLFVCTDFIESKPFKQAASKFLWSTLVRSNAYQRKCGNHYQTIHPTCGQSYKALNDRNLRL